MVYISKRAIKDADEGDDNKKSFKKPKYDKNKKGYLGKKPFNENLKHDGKPKFNADGTKEEFEKPDWSKLKQEKKDLKLKRKQNRTKDLFELTVQAKKIYEKLKNKNATNKEDLARELHKLLNGKGNYSKLVLAHDTARVVQCMLKAAPAEIRNEISQELVPSVVQMSTHKYSHFCVARMLKYGTNNIREKVINSMFGSIVKMTSHSLSSSLIDTAYLTWATNRQKNCMKQEFYGDMYKNSKDESIEKLQDTYKDSPEMRSAILGSIKANLEHCANKKVVDNSLVHTILFEYMNEAEENDRSEIMALFQPFLPSLISTRDGARSVVLFLWFSTVKERRAIIKILKEHVINTCTHEHGYVVIINILTTIDDTVGLKKNVIDTILEQIDTLIANEWGRKVIEWLVCPGDQSLFHPHLIKNIMDGLKYCKKDSDVKRQEIKDFVEKPLCEAIANNPKLWLQGGHTALVTAAILKIAKGEHSRNALNSVADIICDPDWTVLPTEENEKKEVIPDEPKSEKIGKIKKKKKSPYEDDKIQLTKSTEPVVGIEHAGLHLVLKKIAKNDIAKTESNEPTLGESVVQKLTPSVLSKWLQLNRACFLLVVLIESATKETQEKFKKILKEHKALLKEQTFTGAKILLKKI